MNSSKQSNNSTTLIFIGALVVTGALIYVSTARSTEDGERDHSTVDTQSQFYNSEEVSVTANVIIGDLHTEAAEALPSDLQPNTEALVLTDEEETELFSILNSLTINGGASGALGGALGASSRADRSVPTPPLGLSPLTILITSRTAAKSNIDKHKESVASLDGKYKKARGFSKALYKRKLSKAKADLTKAVNHYKALDAKIKRAQEAAAKKKREKEQAEKKAREEKARLIKPVQISISWGRDGLDLLKHLNKQKGDVQSRLKKQWQTINDLKKKWAGASSFRKASYLVQLNAAKAGLKPMEKEHRVVAGKLRSWHDRKARENAEKKRIAAEQAAKLAEKRAREEKEKADKELAESKARAAAQKAKLEKEEAERKRAILEAKRQAEAQLKLAMEKKRQEERAAAAAAARRRFEEAQAKIKAQALAKKAAELAHKQKMLEEKLAREKAAKAERDKQIKLKAALKLQALQAAEKAAKREAERARLEAEKARVLAQEKERKRRAMEEEKRREREHKKKLEKMRRDAEQAKKREEEAKRKQERERAEKDARIKAEREKLAKARKQLEQDAAAMKKRQIELEKKDAEEKAKAKALIKHTAADVVVKTASVSQKGLKGIKAVHRVQQVVAKSKADENAAKLKRIEAGFKRITGIKDQGDRISQLPRLDKKVLADLVKFYKEEDIPEDGYVFVSNILKDKIAREKSTDPKVQAWNKIEKMTGLMRHEFSLRTLAEKKSLEAIEELHAFLDTVPEMKDLATELDHMVSFKKLRNVAGELDLKIDNPRTLASADFEAVSKEGLSKLIRVFESHPRLKAHPAFSEALEKIVDIRQRKNAKQAKPAKGGGKMKSFNVAKNVIVESKAKDNAAKLKRIEAGFKRITGIKSEDTNDVNDLMRLKKLDKEVLADLVKLYKDEGIPEDGYTFVSNILKEKIAQENSTDPKVMAWNKIEEMTGLMRHEFSIRTLFEKQNLDLNVIEELHEYLDGVPEMQLMADEMDYLISYKKLQEVAEQLDIEMGNQRSLFANVDYEAVGKVGLDRITQVFDSRPQMKDQQGFSEVWKKTVGTLAHIEEKLIAQAQAVEEERIRKQNEEIAALEKIRAAEVQRELEEAAAKLAQEKLRVEQEAAQLAQAALAEKERLAAKQQAELEAIERELEEEKRAAAEQIAAEAREVEQELSDELNSKLTDAEAAAEQKLIETKQEQAAVQAQQSAEADEAQESIKAEISEAHVQNNQEVISALTSNLREEAETHQTQIQETQQTFVAEQQAVIKEAEAVKEELVQQFQVELEEEKVQAEQKLAESVEQVESQKQELIEMQQEVHELEKEELEIEVSIQTEVIEEDKRVVEHQQEVVESVDPEDESSRDQHPRASKKGRVHVSKTKNADGSSAISMSVPSDLSPGEVDDISIYVSKQDSETLAMYHIVYKKIVRDESLTDLSFAEKELLASAGAVFKQIREQYVEQRKEKVMRRSRGLASSI